VNAFDMIRRSAHAQHGEPVRPDPSYRTETLNAGAAAMAVRRRAHPEAMYPAHEAAEARARWFWIVEALVGLGFLVGVPYALFRAGAWLLP
jgi:hypothetical protein